jgi:hypothetical protein
LAEQLLPLEGLLDMEGDGWSWQVGQMGGVMGDVLGVPGGGGGPAAAVYARASRGGRGGRGGGGRAFHKMGATQQVPDATHHLVPA